MMARAVYRGYLRVPRARHEHFAAESRLECIRVGAGGHGSLEMLVRWHIVAQTLLRWSREVQWRVRCSQLLMFGS